MVLSVGRNCTVSWVLKLGSQYASCEFCAYLHLGFLINRISNLSVLSITV